jgi:surface protein
MTTMKLRTLFAFLLSIVAGMQSVKAQEAYAVYEELYGDVSLIFYYDNLRSKRGDMTYSLNTGKNKPEWLNVGYPYISVREVIFDSSFANARPTTTYSWFYNMYHLANISHLEYLNTSEVTDMSYMFYGCTDLYDVDLSNFNTSKVTNMSYMFRGCTMLMTFNGLNFNTSKVTDMSYMFYDCHSLSELDLSSFNTSKVTNMTRMFCYCFDLYHIFVGDGWSTAAVTSSDGMFEECFNLVGCQETWYDGSHVDASYAHIDEGTGNPGYLSCFDEPEAYVCYSWVSKTLTFYFDGRRRYRGSSYSLNTGDESPVWSKSGGPYADITRVSFTSSFAQARPTSTKSWFSGMTNLESISGLKYLNTSEVTNMHSMFSRCEFLTSIDVSNFNTDKVTDMGYMFYECKAVKSLDLSNFKTAQVTNMARMFFNCNELESIYAGSGWKTKSVTGSNNMFYRCLKLVGGEGTTFDANHIDAAYAHIDGGTSNPGYFIAKIKGDVNLDGTVDIADAVCVLNKMAGQPVAGDANVNGDYDSKGKPVIDIADLVTVLNIMAGQ